MLPITSWAAAAASSAAGFSWDGRDGRRDGFVLVAAYVVFVATIWSIERQPPALGETADLAEAFENPPSRVGRELVTVFADVTATAVGPLAVVEGVRNLSGVEARPSSASPSSVSQCFELVVLAWSSAHRGITEAVVAAVVGSYAYNATMTLGAGALARPLHIADASSFHLGWTAMLAALAAV